MSAFSDWKDSLPPGQGYSAEEAFNAGMTKAASICAHTRHLSFPAYYDRACDDCRDAIIAARDGE